MLQIISPILIVILKISATLQAPNLNLLSAVDMVVSLKTVLQTIRFENVNFSTQFKEAVSICCQRNINILEVKKEGIQ